jgi:hypothetical protein
VGERGAGDAPSFARRVDAISVGDGRLVEMHFAEVGVAVHLPEGTDRDAGRLHVECERRDAGVFRHARVGAGEKQPPLRVVGPAAPHLGAGHAPLVAVLFGARRQRREVGAGVGLGEQLAPDLLAGADRRQPP